MSRVAKNPVVLPAKVDVSISADSIAVSGPMGKLTQALCGSVKVAREGDAITFVAANDSQHSRSMSGTVRALVANMVRGVSEGFSRKLTLVGWVTRPRLRVIL
jgi:Ribosomal protein L6P/L9E